MSQPSSNHTRPAYSLEPSEWRSIKRFGVLWGIEQYNLNPKELAEVCFRKGDDAYKSRNNVEGNEFMSMVENLVKKFPDIFTEEPEVVEVSVSIDESKSEDTAKANAAKIAQAEGLNDVAHCLLHSTDPNVKGKDGQTLLHVAAKASKTPEVVKALLDAGADLNARNKDGKTPLHEAARWGRVEAMKELLNFGAQPNARDEDKETPLHEAAWRGHIEAMKQLLNSGAQPNARTKYGRTPFHIAAWGGHVEAMKQLLNSGAQPNARAGYGGKTPLHEAARWGHVEAIKLLLNSNVRWMSSNIRWMPEIKIGRLLFEAGLFLLFPARTIKVLLSTGVDAKTFEGKTPLHEAVQWGRIEAIKELLNSGAQPNARDEDEETPLHKVAQDGRVEAIKVLLSSGAQLNVKDKDGETPFHKAIQHGQIEAVKVLLNSGAPLGKIWGNPLRQRIEVSGLGSSDSIYLVSKDKYKGWTPLHIAARHGQAEVIKELLRSGAQLDARDNNGETPLHKAAQHGQVEAIKVLLSSGAQLDAKDKDIETPLQKAAKYSQIEAIKVLCLESY